MRAVAAEVAFIKNERADLFGVGVECGMGFEPGRRIGARPPAAGQGDVGQIGAPFGFQAERRSLWEAKESYWKLSPFLHAETIRAPLLLIHGAEDDNPGTFPLQSERLFHAIKGTGGRARYVSLPHESHAYRARESVLHVLAEMIDWFDEHVKRAARR